MENKKVLEWLYREIQQRKYGAVDRIIFRILELDERFKRGL
jgi:hypothetical protein